MKGIEINDNNRQDSLIQIKGLYKYFGKLQVLKGVSTEIKKGEKVVIIGPSGSGKSTMLRCMNLLEVPTYGEIWFEGKRPEDHQRPHLRHRRSEPDEGHRDTVSCYRQPRRPDCHPACDAEVE